MHADDSLRALDFGNMPFHVACICVELIRYMPQSFGKVRFLPGNAAQLDRGQSVECCCVT